MKLTLQENGYYTGTEEGKEVYFYEMFGHTGHIKKAVELTEGVELRSQRGRSNQLGCSNPGVYVKFVDGPSDQVLANLWQSYRNLCQRRKAATTEVKPVATKTVKATKKEKPGRDFKTYKVSMTGKDAKNYPTYVLDAYTADEAKDTYKMFYDMKHTEILGMAYFWLKASKV